MEKMRGFDKNALIKELLQALEYAKVLKNQFSNPTTNSCSSSSSSSSSSSDDPNQALNSESLLEKMMSSFDKIIYIATSSIDLNNSGQQEFPHSSSCISPKSENSRPDFPPTKKRETMMPKWTKSVQISNGGVISGLEGALDDGFSWRKYGQKDILGARYPRGYYRCTHRHTKGCVATKQVQRSDDDPSIYHILYRGEHTCTQGALQVQDQFDPIHQAQMKSEPLPSPSPQDQEVYVGLGPEGELKVEPEEQAENWAQLLRSFSYSSACLDPEPINNLYFTPAFGSPTISGSNYFPLSSYRPTGPHFGLTVQTPEIDNNEAVSGQNSVTYSPIINDFEFPIDETHDIGIYFS